MVYRHRLLNIINLPQNGLLVSIYPIESCFFHILHFLHRFRQAGKRADFEIHRFRFQGNMCIFAAGSEANKRMDIITLKHYK